MNITERWRQENLVYDNTVSPVYGVSVNTMHDQVAVTYGIRVILYVASTGAMLNSLRGHTDTVYCVEFSPDGKRLASGGADRAVLVWSSEGRGLVKYMHAASVQAVAHNPLTKQMVSVSNVDWGAWTPDAPKVHKQALPSKGLCAAWSPDGQTLAIGTLGGVVLMYDQGLAERQRLHRPAPVWALAFCPMRENGLDVLSVGSWDRRLSFYNLKGESVMKERELDFDPCCITYFAEEGNNMCISGSDCSITLFTKNGSRLVEVAKANDWIWTVKTRLQQKRLYYGTHGGTVRCIDMDMSAAHAIYQDQYVYRDKMTNVVVHQLSQDRKMTVSCVDFVTKVAVYRDRLAVMFSDRVMVYELLYDDEHCMRYQDMALIRKRFDCSLMCVTMSMIVLTQDMRITAYDFQGHKRREWVMESKVTYAKVAGGVAGRELLLAGRKDGRCMKLFMDNAFPISLLDVDGMKMDGVVSTWTRSSAAATSGTGTMTGAIRVLDLSATRTKLAVLDSNHVLKVYRLMSSGSSSSGIYGDDSSAQDLRDGESNKPELLFSEYNVHHVVWNSDYDDMIAYSTENTVYIRTGSLPAYQQELRGMAIGFKASRLFLLGSHGVMMLDVPHSHALYRYIELKDYESALDIATRGVTEGDWKMLGMHAMTHLQLGIARQAFMRIHEVHFVELLNALELRQRQGGNAAGAVRANRRALAESTVAGQDASTTQNTEAESDERATKPEENSAKDGLLLGDVLAFQGKFLDASRQFLRAGSEQRAIEMFSDMKMWEEARRVCSSESVLKEIIRQQARWAEDFENYVEAANLYETSGDYAKAINMMGRAGELDKLMRICLALPKSEVALITDCANYFAQHKAIEYAIEAYEKVNNHRALIHLYVEKGDWRGAFGTLQAAPQYARDVYVPWANWLADNDRFEDALEAFRLARWPREAIRMMEALAANAVTCRKFGDAAYYYIHLAEEYGYFEDSESPSDAEMAGRIRRCNEYVRRADIYYAYSFVYTHTTQPFPYNKLSMMRITRCLLGLVSEGVLPMNVGKGEILYTLARMANRLDMVRTARAVFDKLQSVILPLSVQEQVDVESLLIRSKTLVDREELLDVCARCKQTVPLLPSPGDRCPRCAHPFVRSFVNFEALPLVEFTLADDLTDEEAERGIITGLYSSAKTPTADETAAGDEANSADAVDSSDSATTAAAALNPDKMLRTSTGANVMTFTKDNLDVQIDQELLAMGRSKAMANKGNDIFFSQLQYATRTNRPKDTYEPFVANAEMLRQMPRDEVFIVKPSYGVLPVANRYYRVTNSDVTMVLCRGCQHFFISADYEAEMMKGKGCPLCRFTSKSQAARTLEEIMTNAENSLNSATNAS